MKKVWVNGAFDILHIGHIRLLEYASKLGSVCVGLDTDHRIKKLKGKNRPYNTLTERVEFLLSLKYVNNVCAFDTDERLRQLIKEYQPDLMVIGSDYKNRIIIGREYIPQVVYFDRIENKSTTGILEYEKNLSNR